MSMVDHTLLGVDSTWEQIKGIGSQLVATIKGIFGIKSPSTVMRDQIGANLMKGMAQGITQYAPEAQKAMREATASLTGMARMEYKLSAVNDQIFAASNTHYSGGTWSYTAQPRQSGTDMTDVLSLLRQLVDKNERTAVMTPDGSFVGWIDSQMGERADLARRYI